MKKAYIDANVILRFLTKDPPSMAEAALKIFDEAKKGKISIVIILLTVAEVVWVLESFYGFSKKEIAEILSQFLFCDGLEVEDLSLLINALKLYQEKNLDFADALLATTAVHEGVPFIYSFDQHFKRVDSITKLEPGQTIP
jgi:predicted nucleic acid-binding protein